MWIQKPRTCAVRRFLQMEREFSSPRALMGKVTLVGTVSEYLPFIFSKRLLARVEMSVSLNPDKAPAEDDEENA